MARRSTTTVELPHQSETTLPDGRVVSQGDRFTVDGRNGWFKFRYLYTRDGSIAAWGPTNEEGSSGKQAQANAFRPEQVRKISNKKARK